MAALLKFYNVARQNVVPASVVFLLTWLGLTTAASPTRYTIEEELRKGHVIGNIVTDAHLARNFSSVLDSLRFGLMHSKSQKYFTIDSSSGLLTINNSIDRDTLCPQTTRDCVLAIDVAITQPTLDIFEVIPVTVTVLDKNDNAPRFSNDRLKLSISEYAPLESKYMLPTAFDPDSGMNGIQGYELRSGFRNFRLQETGSLGTPTDLSLVLQTGIDRERQTTYSLQLLAKDAGSPSLTGTLHIEVHIVDANDNSPSFDKPAYNITLREDEQVNQPVIQVHASDPDEGMNGRVIYYFAQHTKDLYGSQFGISNITGDIYLLRPLDSQQAHQYQLTVTAQDLGPDALKSYTKVYVTVTDINNHRPMITVSPVVGKPDISVMENQTPPTIVGVVAVEDPDQGENGNCICQIQDQSFMLQRLYKNGYKIVTRKMFDREQHEMYTTVIECRDNGTPPLRSSKQIQVRIVDANDHPPVFTQRNYTVSLKENSPINLPIVRVNATDADSAVNARITYSIEPRVQSSVKINEVTGVISTVSNLDHEQQSELKFAVYAVDNGNNPKTATAQVKIIVVDVNDEPPKFYQEHYNFGTFENQDAGTEIGTVGAEDADSRPFNNFTFTLAGRDDKIFQTFRMDPFSGLLSTRKILDRETQTAYHMTVMVTGNMPPRQSATVSVTIYVADVNDNAPTITYPNPRNNTLQLSAFSPLGFHVAQVLAHDVDLGKNAKLKFSLNDADSDSKFFHMDPYTGDITVKKELDDFPRDSISLKILVSDAGDPAHSAFDALEIVINKSLDFARANALVPAGPLMTLGEHEKIIIILGAVTGVLVIILIAAIIFVKKRQGQHANEAYKYMQRVDFSQKMTPTGPAPAHDMSFEAASIVSDASSEHNRKEGAPYISVKTNGQPQTALPTGGNLFIRNPLATRVEGRRSMERAGTPQRLSMSQPPPAYPSLLPRESSTPRGHPLMGQGHPTTGDPSHGQMPFQPLDHVARAERDSDTTSGCSADVSNTDSGHGPSEEGEGHDHLRPHSRSRPPPQPASNRSSVALPDASTPTKDPCPVHGLRSRNSVVNPLDTLSPSSTGAYPASTGPMNYNSEGPMMGNAPDVVAHGSNNNRCSPSVMLPPTQGRHGKAPPRPPYKPLMGGQAPVDKNLSYIYPQSRRPNSAKEVNLPHLTDPSLLTAKKCLMPVNSVSAQSLEDSDDDVSSTSGSFIVNMNDASGLKSVDV